MSSEHGQPSIVDPQPDRDPFETLASEFVERLRRGETPSVDVYAAEHPELADDIRELFPTIARMEHLKVPSEELRNQRTVLGTVRLKRLGDFRILREIGRGGMGIVYEAQQESLRRRVAVKVLPKSALLDAKHLKRFQREARTAAGLHHTNIVPVFGVGQQDDFQYYVMQYIEGVGLDRMLTRLERLGKIADGDQWGCIVRDLLDADSHASDARTNETEGHKTLAFTPAEAALQPTKPVLHEVTAAVDPPNVFKDEVPKPVAERTDARGFSSYWNYVAQIGVQVADALEYAHNKGVLHRDIKPANLIVDVQGIVWVADFGLAKALEQEHLSRTGDIMGTPAYMAPEQVQGRADCRSDLYSLGLTLYELLTLRSAFPQGDRALLLKRMATEEPTQPRQICPEIPRDLETIVMKAVAREPKRRYGSAAELAADLRCFLEDRPIRARRTSSVERFWRWCRRNPIVAGLSATAVALLLLVTMVSSIGYVRTTRALAGEREQRERAEYATQVALEVLDRIYERFAPNVNQMTNGQIVKPVLSEGAAAVFEDLLTFYDRLAEQGGNAKYLEKIALANRRIGDIRHHLGQFDQAKAAYEQALAVYEQLDRSSKKPHFLEIATTYTELGIVVDWLGEFDKAMDSWKTALGIFQQAENAGMSSPEIHRGITRAKKFLARPSGKRRPPPFGPSGFGRPRPGPPGETPGAFPSRPPDSRHGRPGPPHPPISD